MPYSLDTFDPSILGAAFSAKPIQLRHSLVVTTTWLTLSGVAQCEVVLTSLDKHTNIRGVVISITAGLANGPAQAKGSEESSSLDYVQTCAVEWAISTMEADLLTWYEAQSPGTPYPAAVELTELGPDGLKHLWTSRRLNEPTVKALRSATRSGHRAQFYANLCLLPQVTITELMAPTPSE